MSRLAATFFLIDHGMLVQKKSLQLTNQHAGIKNSGLRRRGHTARWVRIGPQQLAELIRLFDDRERTKAKGGAA